jgi:hypothetical protein
MKQLGMISKQAMACGVALFAASLLVNAETAPSQGKAEVKAVRGSAKYSTGGGVWVPLKVGTVLNPGAQVMTSAESTVDLFLGKNGPVVRVTPETTLGLDKLTVENTGAESVIETQLNLQSGRILGRVKKLAAASRYDIKLPNGVAGVRGTDYDISVTPLGNGKFKIRVTSITGQLVGTVVVDGRTITALIKDGETWTPEDGVSAADPELLRAGREILDSITFEGFDRGTISVGPGQPPISSRGQ